MTDHDKAAARRTVLRAGVAAVAAGLAGSALAQETAARRVFAQEKLAKEAVQYQDQPKDGVQCSTCVNFVAPNACQIVAGEIKPEGWCIAYGPKAG